MAISEEEFRTWLDAGGILRRDAAFTPPRPEESFTVFAQAASAALPIGPLRQQAARFFDAKLGLTVDKKYDDASGLPDVDVARVVIVAGDARGTRLVHGRAVTNADLARAHAADPAGSGGLYLLAERCRSVWIVEANGEADRASLLVSAILASVVLGPILSMAGDLFGVRTARLKLEAKPSPYR